MSLSPCSTMTSLAKKTNVLTVSWYSGEWISHLVNNLESKASHPDRLEFTIIDNTNGNDKDLASALRKSSKARILHFASKSSQPSRAHASAITFGLSAINDSWCVLFDPDVYVFQHGWDQWCRSKILDEGYIAAGAPYPPWKLGKYHDFPSPIFAAMNLARIQALNATWEPFFSSSLGLAYSFVMRKLFRAGGFLNRTRLTHSTSWRQIAYLGERLAGVYAPDTGYRIAAAANRHNTTAYCLKTDWDGETVNTAGSPCWRNLANAYELFTECGRPFAAHCYGSSMRQWRSRFSGNVGFFRDLCEACNETLHADTPAR